MAQIACLLPYEWDNCVWSILTNAWVCGLSVVGICCMHRFDHCMGKLELFLEVVLANIVLSLFHWNACHRRQCSILSIVLHHVVGDCHNGCNHIVGFNMVCDSYLTVICVWSVVNGSNLMCSFNGKYHKILGVLNISLDGHPRLWLLVPSIPNSDAGNNHSYHSINISPCERILLVSLRWTLLCLLQTLLLQVLQDQ